MHDTIDAPTAILAGSAPKRPEATVRRRSVRSLAIAAAALAVFPGGVGVHAAASGGERSVVPASAPDEAPVVAASPVGEGPVPSVVVAPAVPSDPGPAAAPKAGAPRSTPVAGCGTSCPPRQSRPRTTATTAVTQPSPVRANPNAFAFMSTDDQGRPARWDPCTEIRWAYNTSQAPDGAQQLIAQALEHVTAAAGLRFRYVGTTGFRPFLDRPSSRPAGIDAVIGFGDRRDYSEFNGGTLGLGGMTWTSSSVGPRAIFGEVAVDAAGIRRLQPGFGPGATAGGLLIHELGHMVGLGHVKDGNQVMQPSLGKTSPATYAAGDRNGLARVGAPAGCFPSEPANKGTSETTSSGGDTAPAPATTSTTTKRSDGVPAVASGRAVEP